MMKENLQFLQDIILVFLSLNNQKFSKLRSLKTLLILLFPCVTFSQDVWVSGYYRNDGTYVNGYYRTSPDYTTNNNYSTLGNINPYNGKVGTLTEKKYSSGISVPDYYTPPPEIIYIPVPKIITSNVPDNLKITNEELGEIYGNEKIDLYSPPDDFKPENDYYFGKSIASPVKPVLEEHGYSYYTPTVQKETGESFIESLFIGIIALLFGVFAFITSSKRY